MRLALTLAALTIIATTTHAQTPLATTITTLLADPAVTHAHWGIAITTLDGIPLYSLDEAKLFRPSSNAKLFTTAAAIAILGPDKTFTTTVRGKLDKTTGIVTGDLYLVGGGDANFDSDDLPYIPAAQREKKPTPFRNLQSLADQLTTLGVKQITGKVLGDDTLFPWDPHPEGWGDDDLLWGYGAPISALTISDNALKLTITPSKITGTPGHEVYSGTINKLEQYGVDYYTLKNESGTRRASESGSVNVEATAEPRTLRVYGNLPANANPDVEHLAINDPALYAAMAFAHVLTQTGITISGDPSAKHHSAWSAPNFASALKTPDACDAMLVAHNGACGGSCGRAIPYGDILATHTSDPLAEDIKYTLKTSANLHAELMLHHLGRERFCGQGTTLEGAQMVQAFLLHANIDPTDFIFYDGSGLSTKDLVTPRATAQLLAYAATQPWFLQWKSALPIGGIDGTLSDRFKEAPLKGHVFAKTGTLGESRALSGYVDTASGHTVIFAIYVDNHTPGTTADRTVMDKIVAAIAANN